MPRAGDGVADGNEDSSEDHEAGKLNTLSNRSRNDGRCGCCEHRLEDEVAVTGHCEGEATICPCFTIAIIEVTDRPPNADEAIEVARIVSIEPDERVTEQPDADDEDVLEKNVHHILLLAETCF